MSAGVCTPLFRSEAEALALARDLAAPEQLDLFLTALRERHARQAALPIPVPAKPIALEIP